MSSRSITIEIAGMHCASCAILVDDCMEDLDGVVSSQTDVTSGRCVTVVEDTVSDADVLAAVIEAGYTGTIVQVAVAS